MEYLKAFGKGSLEGACVGGTTAVLLNAYDKLIKDAVPLWLRVTVDTLLASGTIYLGFKATDALNKYLDE